LKLSFGLRLAEPGATCWVASPRVDVVTLEGKRIGILQYCFHLEPVPSNEARRRVSSSLPNQALTAVEARQNALSLKNRRDEYSWRQTRLEGVRLITDKKSYPSGETVTANLGFRVLGGLREAFHPDVWTLAWEDFDKILRLTMKVSLGVHRGPFNRRLAEIKKEVRKASFYWSRDPDLPYRIWAMVIPEDGGPPKIPRSVEDAKSKMLDVEKTFRFPASRLGKGRHRLVGDAYVSWGRRSFIEKGTASSRSRPVVIEVD
jgi:hypothetical protein